MAISTATVPGQILTSAYVNNNINSGLTYISATTIGSAVSTVIVSSCFSTTYDNYRIVISGANFSTLCGVKIGMNSSTGSTYSTANMNMVYSSTTITGEAANNTTTFSIATGQGPTSISFDLINPFATASTQYFAQSAGDTYVSWRSGRDSALISNTGFTMSMTGGTVTGGTITVFGYRKA